MSQLLRCKQCDCKVLKTDMAEALVEEHEIPSNITGTKQKFNNWYKVKNMFDFENIGMLRVDENGVNTRYLTCADCEHDVVGFQQDTNYFLASDMVVLKE